jgi:hypothetical protein
MIRLGCGHRSVLNRSHRIATKVATITTIAYIAFIKHVGYDFYYRKALKIQFYVTIKPVKQFATTIWMDEQIRHPNY